ncbi:endonuclease/exonuclease/phosphatase family protein [Dysgonomonas sp. OttesenSCG-928-M03]|nr:endonuclease/exonuclease/phosphatase family protein [Dysgonomonas sp. OttesenSCG-928-M03]
MKSLFYLICFSLVFWGCNSQTNKTEPSAEDEKFRVLQFNIWQEGTIVPGGYEGVIRQILDSKADFITFSEVRNYKDTRFCDRIVQSLKDSGQVFYSFFSTDSGILSRFPIIDSTTVYPCINDHGSAYRALIDMNGQEIALYTTHLDYLNCTYYDVKGYDGSTWKKRPPMIDVDSILANNTLSLRDDGMQAIIEKAKEDKAKNRIVIIGGDFNEPSHLDWVESTKDLYDHQGLIIPWTVSKMLTDNGYIDTYREIYPDPLTHPGITYPADCPEIEIKKLTWAPESDERERIDFIYYAPYTGLKLTDAVVWGPKGSIKNSQRIKEDTEDPIEIGGGIWPTDHKAVLATFELK